MKNVIFFGLLCSVLLISCKKEQPAEPISSNYFPLNIGNYWVYETIKIDTAGNEESQNRIDSVIISQDTIINGHVYFVLEGTEISREWMIHGIYRDSAEYLISADGSKYFSGTDFDNVLNSHTQLINGSNELIISTKMERVQDPINVPAGNFDVINRQTTYNFDNNRPDIPNIRYADEYFADGVGKILDTYFYSSSNIKFERRLLRYHIQ